MAAIVGDVAHLQWILSIGGVVTGGRSGAARCSIVGGPGVVGGRDVNGSLPEKKDLAFFSRKHMMTDILWFVYCSLSFPNLVKIERCCGVLVGLGESKVVELMNAWR